MDDSHDSGICIEKDNEDANVSRESPSSTNLPSRRQQLNKKSFKSLTVLSDKESTESLQKIRRRNDSNRRIFFGRGLTSGEKRNRKKYYRKKFDKSNISEMSIRKVKNKLVTDENGKLVNIVDPWKLVNKPGKGRHRLGEPTIEDADVAEVDLNGNISVQIPAKNNPSDSGSIDAGKIEGPAGKILHCFEKLRLGENPPDVNSMSKDQSAQNPAEAKNAIDYSSGDVQQDFSLDLNLGIPDESFSDMACAQMFDSKRRSVQWKREVDVIYYAGDSNGGRVIRRENEPLREETEQQARRNKFIQLALTKKFLTNVSACQLRDPWLVVMPK